MRGPRAFRLPALILLMVLGAFIGNIVGEIAAPYWPVFGNYARLGLAPTEINLLNTVDLTLGFNFNLNVFGGLGALSMLMFWWKR